MHECFASIYVYIICLVPKEEDIRPIANGVMEGYKLLVWVLGMEHGFSGRIAMSLNC